MVEPGAVICIGGAAVDRKYRAHEAIMPATSNPVSGVSAFGGVARNVAENLAGLGVASYLVSAVGDDQDGRALCDHLRSVGVNCEFVLAFPAATASYIAALDPDGSLVVAMADMSIFDRLTPDRVGALDLPLEETGWLFADCNLPSETLALIVAKATRARLRLAVDAVSVAKSSRLPNDLAGVDLLFVNRDEALAAAGGREATPEEAGYRLQQRGAGNVVVTLGSGGCIFCGAGGTIRVPAGNTRMLDATGAGDALIAGTLAGLVNGKPLSHALAAGTALAGKVVASTRSVTSG